MRKKFFELKDIFTRLIQENLSGTNALSPKDLKPYRDAFKRESLNFYKYTEADYYSIRNIETGAITLKNCSEFNDIFEGVPSFNKIEELKESDVIRKSAVITCFSEERNNLLMFAHYAKSYSGMCIEYDFSLLKRQDLLTYYFPILYEKSPSKLANIKELSNAIENEIRILTEGKISLKKMYDIVSFFIHKPSIWSYEKEWRFIIPIEQYNNVFNEKYKPDKKIYILKDFDCITKIYLGYNMEPIKKEHIKEVVSRKNKTGRKIELYDTSLYGNQYKLKTTRIL